MGRKGANSELSGFKLLAVTIKHLLQVKQVLLLPITVFIGAEQAFMAVDFTAVSNLIFLVSGIFTFFLYSPLWHVVWESPELVT